MLKKYSLLNLNFESNWVPCILSGNAVPCSQGTLDQGNSF